MAMLHHTTYATPNDGWKYSTFVEDSYFAGEAGGREERVVRILQHSSCFFNYIFGSQVVTEQNTYAPKQQPFLFSSLVGMLLFATAA